MDQMVCTGRRGDGSRSLAVSTHAVLKSLGASANILDTADGGERAGTGGEGSPGRLLGCPALPRGSNIRSVLLRAADAHVCSRVLFELAHRRSYCRAGAEPLGVDGEARGSSAAAGGCCRESLVGLIGPATGGASAAAKVACIAGGAKLGARTGVGRQGSNRVVVACIHFICFLRIFMLTVRSLTLVLLRLSVTLLALLRITAGCRAVEFAGRRAPLDAGYWL